MMVTQDRKSLQGIKHCKDSCSLDIFVQAHNKESWMIIWNLWPYKDGFWPATEWPGSGALKEAWQAVLRNDSVAVGGGCPINTELLSSETSSEPTMAELGTEPRCPKSSQNTLKLSNETNFPHSILGNVVLWGHGEFGPWLFRTGLQNTLRLWGTVLVQQGPRVLVYS